MKAVLVIDEMPENCHKCPFYDGIRNYDDNNIDGDKKVLCRGLKKGFRRVNRHTIALWGRGNECPLRPLPQKYGAEKDMCSVEDYNYSLGRDDCIDEITGKTE